MDRSEALAKINEIARDVFENESVTLTEESSARDVEEWDSLTHLSLIGDIEDEFGITFTLAETTSARNVGELLNALMRHLDKH